MLMGGELQRHMSFKNVTPCCFSMYILYHIFVFFSVGAVMHWYICSHTAPPNELPRLARCCPPSIVGISNQLSIIPLCFLPSSATRGHAVRWLCFDRHPKCHYACFAEHRRTNYDDINETRSASMVDSQESITMIKNLNIQTKCTCKKLVFDVLFPFVECKHWIVMFTMHNVTVYDFDSIPTI
jgi:hypothetical protein